MSDDDTINLAGLLYASDIAADADVSGLASRAVAAATESFIDGGTGPSLYCSVSSVDGITGHRQAGRRPRPLGRSSLPRDRNETDGRARDVRRLGFNLSPRINGNRDMEAPRGRH